MKRWASCLVLMAAVCAGGCASGESYVKAGYDFGQAERVAVVSVEGYLGSRAAANQVADFFNMELMKRGYSVVERTQAAAILKEQDFQHSGVTRPENAVEAGRILNVDAVLIVNIPRAEEKISMTAKLIDVESGELLWQGFGTGTTGRTLATIGGAAVGGLAGAALGGDRGGRVIGGVVGGVVGGAAGHGLSPQEEKQVRRVVARTCEELPCRTAGPS
jgi:outer membrane lipoprotein SlyB